ncbi:TonB-dependent receptor [Bacteroides eggerthii]|uniref:TonB-dependent Receptor Plug domain-containing protein n=2 Tax=Bacteroides eggerthii TaxID=28111 RepID=E5X1J0_9BACE|nr:TonB-dependent receptor [Bacteroides eggerthii]EFV29016.1 TonB-dependent Receptor Plug domain-containing protein [Bacteroides eggerthii 1_2_48FAA]MBT9881007.1 TonB-dependent receptor plug domain-containing protein [Bacteroides eggerthii]RGU00784.1 TonB-dependent receptor [Bacteroides eggerthii]RHB92133.1 TonB-dependent receptor [Bacteroides eggerthii]RHF03963.1 TonB-dependent receptor [Bacteroides eggerthii]
MISGKVISTEKEVVDFATVYLKGTGHGGITNQEGIYHVSAPAGNYTLVVSAVGYKTVEKPVTLLRGQRVRQNITISPETQQLDEVTVVSTGVSRLKRSAFNAVAVDTKELQNTTKNLSDALAKAPGMKLRESGGVGSDMQLMLDGFSGKHVKVFIDGVPQEGVGSSFGLNNIPVNFADRIEVYKGVVPVGFGTDAIGGVINIVTNKKRRRWFLDASYSYGSFNTHKSNVNFGQTFKNGFTYEINAFQNYSDNDYHIEAPVEDFETGRIDRDKKVRVKRFNDTYHNEAIVGKVGVVDKKWADRLMLGFTYSNMYQDIQTGVRQDIVYGQKHRKGHSLMPSLEYYKRNLFAKGLDVALTVNYNKNLTTNVDTASYKYNWYGDRKLLNSPGEQSYQHSRADNNNWNGTFTANYRLGKMHMLTFNHVLNTFSRSNTSLLAKEEQSDAIAKETRKNISGVSYRLMPSETWNLSVFGKYYNQFVAGPVATDANQNDYVRTTRSVSSIGYGAAGTYFILPGLQAKLSYEKAYRLPTIEEMFGNEDLEMGDIGIRPENSDNVNLNLSYNRTFGRHSVYVEGGLVYRNTKDYIQRNITDLSGGKSAATYINYGKVLTKGYNISARYGFGKWVSVGGNFTQMDVRDNMKTSISGSAENIAYKERMPNLPYIFADSDVTFYWRDLGRKGNALTVSYDNQYLHSFTYYSSKIGSNKGDYVVPSQFSHNLSLSYSLRDGRYNLSFECRNFTDEQLYDNFSLQKAGRAFYGKVRVYFGN